MTQTLERAQLEIESTEPAPAEHQVVVEGRELLADVLDGQEPATLEEWRYIIDELDFSLFSVMAARVAATEHVSILKARQEMQAVDLGREKEILAQGRSAALAMGVEHSAVQGLLLALMGRAHQQHNEARRTQVVQ